MHHLRRRSLERRKELPIDKKILQPKDSYIQISIVRIRHPLAVVREIIARLDRVVVRWCKTVSGWRRLPGVDRPDLEAPIVLSPRSSDDYCRVPRCGQEERSGPISSVAPHIYANGTQSSTGNPNRLKARSPSSLSSPPAKTSSSRRLTVRVKFRCMVCSKNNLARSSSGKAKMAFASERASSKSFSDAISTSIVRNHRPI